MDYKGKNEADSFFEPAHLKFPGQHDVFRVNNNLCQL